MKRKRWDVGKKMRVGKGIDGHRMGRRENGTEDEMGCDEKRND
jgi:hypothetical protein